MKTDLRRILIVDDCEEDRENAKKLLNRASGFIWQFTEASNGERGLALALSGDQFDCVILDHSLRDMDGMEFLQRLPKQLGEPSLATIMLTGSGDEALAVRAMKLGAQDYLSKRDLDATLVRSVENAITHSHLALANRRTAKSLEEAHRELKAFTYSVSHDLRTPLRHIAGFSDILISDFGPGMAVEARQMLQHISDAVMRMESMVAGLLALTRLDRQSLQMCRIDLNTLVDQVVSVLGPECTQPVEWRVARLPELECDPTLISQVLQNLISNALKYSRGQTCPKIEIGSIQEAGKAPVIFVRDNGAGFDMRYAGRLFSVFQRMHTEAEFQGTGVGLATAHRIIKKHGGSIWADAEVDHGATFYFTLESTDQAQAAPNGTGII